MIRKQASLLIRSAFLLLAILLLFQQSRSQDLQQEISRIIDSVRTAQKIPGITATVIMQGKTIDQATGYSDTVERTALRPEHKMLAGSTGKMYFAISAMKLAGEGKLDLDAPVKKYLGKYDWFQRVPNADSMTVRQLMNHTAGIQEYYGLGNFLERLRNEPDKIWRTSELVSYVFDQKPLFSPGSSFSYADTHYLLLQLIIENITGSSAFKYIQKHIIDRVGLKHTQPSLSRTIPALANGYSNPRSVFALREPMLRNGVLIIHPGFEGGGGGFASNSHDLATLVHALMHNNILPARLVDEMKQEVAALQLGRNQFYGLGLQIVRSPFGTSYGHSGWFPGYLSDVQYFPDLDVTIAVQFNTDAVRMQPKWVLNRIAGLLKR